MRYLPVSAPRLLTGWFETLRIRYLDPELYKFLATFTDETDLIDTEES